MEDDPRKPQFIETVPKKGYRLIANVERLGEMRKLSRSDRNLSVIAVLAGTLLLVVAGVAFTHRPVRPHLLHATQLTNAALVIPNNGGDLDSPLLTDGARLYFSDLFQGHITIQQVSATGGEPQTIPTPFENPALFDISVDGTELLVGSSDGH